MISFLLLIYEKRNWYHWKAWLFLFTMMCHLPWLCNHGMCSTPEYRAKSEVKCCKMHCFQHRSLHFFWRCNVFWIEPMQVTVHVLHECQWCNVLFFNPNSLGCVQNRIEIGGFGTVRVRMKCVWMMFRWSLIKSKDMNDVIPFCLEDEICLE